MNKMVQYNKIKTVIINGRKKCIYMKPRGTREYVKYNKEFILLNRYIKLISKKLKKQKGGTQIDYSHLSAHANDKDSFDLLKDSITRIDWDALSTNTDPRAIELLSTNPAMINLDLFNKKQTEANKKKLETLLSDRARADTSLKQRGMLEKDIQTLKKMRSQLQKRQMPINPYHYFEESKISKLSEFNNINPVNWDALSTNTNKFAIDLLIQRPEKINWKLFNIFQTKKNKDYLMNLLLETHYDYISDYAIKDIQGSAFATSTNETFLKKNLNGKNFWDALSINRSRHALDLLIENFERINWKYFIKYQPVENKEFVLNSLLLGYDSNAITNHYINPYIHLLEGRASTDLDFINLLRLIPDINWEALSTNSDPRAVEILFSNIDKVNVELFMAFQRDPDRNLMKQEIDRILLNKLRSKYDR
jgi:hypothetical protein